MERAVKNKQDAMLNIIKKATQRTRGLKTEG